MRGANSLPSVFIGVVLIGAGMSPAWATFSIVAVDTVTREVGSAGASCLQGALNQSVFIITDVFPGKGAIHTQAQWNATNQQRAHDRMVAGDSPQQIMAYVQQNDAQNNPGVRQYGVVDLFQGAPRSAAFTGANCTDWKGHATGRNYSIQGNILAYQNMPSQGNRVVDSIQARFLRTPGTLADKLMAALQGGKWRGADNRCWAEGVSTQSAFLRVARPTDSPTSLYLDLRVPSRPTGMDPIDSLQKLFDKWRSTVSLAGERAGNRQIFRISTFSHMVRLESELFRPERAVFFSMHKLTGETVFEASVLPRGNGVSVAIPAGLHGSLYVVRARGPGLDARARIFVP